MSEHVFEVSTTNTHISLMAMLLVFRSVDDVLVQVKPSLHQAFSTFHRSSTSWIFISYTHCCTTPEISKFKTHDDPGALWWSYDYLTQCSLAISCCNITFSVFWLSRGSIATLIRSGGWSSCHTYHSFVILTVKAALKYIDVWQSYREK